MKTASSTSAAISSNEKTFPIFARKLASGEVKDFTSTAYKLTVWLNSEKAYYAAARPKIVELLEIALRTFMDTFIHHPAVTELSEHLRRLIQIVIPFCHLFPEAELKSRLERVILDVNTSLPKVPTSSILVNTPFQGSAPANMTTSPSQASPGCLQPTSISPVQLPREPMQQTEPSLPVPNVVNTSLDHSLHVDASRAQNPTQHASPGKTEAIAASASPVTNTLAGNTSVTISSKPQPKRTRRTELSEALVARDLDWFISNQTHVAVNGDPSIFASKVTESVPPQAIDAPHVPKQPPTPKIKSARMIPSRLPPRISSSGLDVISSTSSPAFATPAQKSEPVIKDEVITVEEVPQPEDTQSQVEQPVVTLSNEPFIEPEISEAECQVSGEASLMNVEIPISARSPPRASVDVMESMDLSTSDQDSGSHLSEPLSPLPLYSPTLKLRPPSLPPPVTAMELDLDFSVSQVFFGQAEQWTDHTDSRRFDEITVIHSIQGKPFTHTHMVGINLNESTFSRISKWVHKKYHSEACQGVSISLACYHLPDVFRSVAAESGKHEIEELISHTPCSWPQSNRLSLHINDKERRTVVVLSPPLFLTPDRLVDVSSLMQLGENTLEIRQQDDLSQFLLVLLAHSPTRAQLAELDVVKTVDERWTRFLDALSWRTVTGKPDLLDTAPTGVVGGL